MIVDGKAIASGIYKEIANQVTHLSHTPHLTVFTCAPNFETKKYLALKKRKALEVGISVNIIELPETLTTAEVVQSVQHACMQTDGIIVQLPLPPHIDTDAVLEAIPQKYDVDGMHYDGTSNTIMSPVVAAISEIVTLHDVLLASQKVVIVGNGRLVGAPAAVWAKGQGAQVTVLDKESDDIASKIATADVLILGAGVAGLVKPDMVAQGVVIFDAGTSEDGGELKGDADADCSDKASLITPVPGGIGPVTVAVLLRNVVQAAIH
ncbi:MAG: methylenetetrahydrofolate dehydrogenase (NADP+)/methenyltetrahydrofolate cyclohydrolase [Acidimicrobiales bacterium]|jgi:methylenetetrahydrofolate dehydrogenase (NADP+)/methenyltetrahydrofolate cyclohydrolase